MGTGTLNDVPPMGLEPSDLDSLLLFGSGVREMVESCSSAKYLSKSRSQAGKLVQQVLTDINIEALAYRLSKLLSVLPGQYVPRVLVIGMSVCDFAI